MEEFVRSDLACDRIERLQEEIQGVKTERETIGDCEIQRHWVSVEAEKQIDKPHGCYVTMRWRDLRYLTDEAFEKQAEMLSKELGRLLRGLMGDDRGKNFQVLVVGLGNDELTADAVGPKVVDGLTVTRHLQALEPELFRALSCGSLAAIVPGVLGRTGIEASELLEAAVGIVSPSLIIAVDALAAGSLERLACTVQLSDTGIVPGSGVGNHRKAITRESMGVPVISVGVPTVVNSSTLVCDLLSRAGISEPDSALLQELEKGRQFFVSPRDCDALVDRFACLISRAIELTFVGDLRI